MNLLVRIADSPFNDRPRWRIGQNNWKLAPKDFQDMKGQLVNRYVEAQRILREHGEQLVKLGLLRE